MFLFKNASCPKAALQQRLIVGSFIGLLVVALLGVLLRLFPFVSNFPFTYKNLLHGHSHFAFGGWVMPVLLALVIKSFPAIKEKVAFRHWRNITAMVMLSAYGMLASFPMQGYAPVSIFFSMLSIVATVYLAVIIWKATEEIKQRASINFLKWGLLYACFSAIGPFATGPLVAMGKGGSPLYFDAIYFYLHFQYNGFFTFTVLSLFYRMMEQRGYTGSGNTVFGLFNYACFPAFALSVLWSEPGPVFNLVGGLGALLQVVGVFYLSKDAAASGIFRNKTLLTLSLSAFVLKNVLQLLSALPVVARMAFLSRNFVIAYLHLVLLGFISLAVFGMVLKQNMYSRYGSRFFLFSFITTETLLVINASSAWIHVTVPHYAQLLLLCSLFFPVGILLMLPGLYTRKYSAYKQKVKPVFSSQVTF